MKRFISDQYVLVLLVSAVLALFYNSNFYIRLEAAFPLSQGNGSFLIAAGTLLFLLILLIFTLLASRLTTKPILIFSVLFAALCHHFMTAYGIVIDKTMWQNIAQTDTGESRGLLNLSLIWHLGVMGILPALIIWKWKIHYRNFRKEASAKAFMLAGTLILGAITFFPFAASFASLFREHKPVRYYTNPTYAFYSAGKYLAVIWPATSPVKVMEPVSLDAKIASYEKADILPRRKLVIMVVGESARADHFQLNGYKKETNPELSKIPQVVSFSNFTSCGTSTAVSVPCMFSQANREHYDHSTIYAYENALDVLKRVGIKVLWRDNNSSSKGVAERVEYQDFRTAPLNSICDTECRDEGMLAGLQEYIDQHPTGDLLIILHAMGSHGPEYFLRYPESYKYFTPTCDTSDLGDCQREFISNAYDNTILYADHFLAETIRFLQKNEEEFAANMLYISDHGESLGEKGVYLHGMPYPFAPDAQKHVGAIIWLGKHSDISFDGLQQIKDKPYSQDALYCSLLSMFDVQTKDCPAEKTFLPAKVL